MENSNDLVINYDGYKNVKFSDLPDKFIITDLHHNPLKLKCLNLEKLGSDLVLVTSSIHCSLYGKNSVETSFGAIAYKTMEVKAIIWESKNLSKDSKYNSFRISDNDDFEFTFAIKGKLVADLYSSLNSFMALVEGRTKQLLNSFYEDIDYSKKVIPQTYWI